MLALAKHGVHKGKGKGPSRNKPAGIGISAPKGKMYHESLKEGVQKGGKGSTK